MATNLLKLLRSEIKKTKRIQPVQIDDIDSDQSARRNEASKILSRSSQSDPQVDVFNILDFTPHPLVQYGDIPFLYYSPSFIPSEMAQHLSASVEQAGLADPDTWKTLRTRRLQCWESSSFHPLPSWLLSLIDYLVRHAVFDPRTCSPNHVLINQYQRGQGILHHTDGPKYVNRVAILSLGTPCLMTFRRRLQSSQIGVAYEGDLFSILLQPNSLLVFSDELYIDYMHGIHDVESETVGADGVTCLNKDVAGVQDGEVIERGERLSFTIRQMLS